MTSSIYCMKAPPIGYTLSMQYRWLSNTDTLGFTVSSWKRGRNLFTVRLTSLWLHLFNVLTGCQASYICQLRASNATGVSNNAFLLFDWKWRYKQRYCARIKTSGKREFMLQMLYEIIAHCLAKDFSCSHFIINTHTSKKRTLILMSNDHQRERESLFGGLRVSGPFTNSRSLNSLTLNTNWDPKRITRNNL